MGIILATASLIGFPHRGLTLTLALDVAWRGLTYLAAPVVAVIAERDVRRHLDVDHIRSTSTELAEVPV